MKINEKIYIELYNAGKNVYDLAQIFDASERTIERYETRLRRQGKIKYRKDLTASGPQKGKFQHKEVLEEVQVYLDNAKQVLSKYNDPYKKIKLKTTWDKTKQTEDLALVWSDMHTGMINKHPLNGDITYNETIQEQELESLLRGVFRFQQLYKPSYNLEKLYIFDAGDNVTNDRIYEGQQTEITCGVGEQIIKTFEYQSNFIKRCLEIFPKIVMMKVPGNHGRCFDKNTRILTERGYKTYKEIFKGEIVATVNLDTQKIEWQPIEDIFIFQNEPQMCFARTKTASISVTPDHTLINWDRSSKRYKKSYAGNLWNQKRGIVIPITFPSGKEEYPITDKTLKFLAWIVTDGSVQLRNGLQYFIWQSKEKYVKEITELLENLKLKFTVHGRKRKIKSICGKKLKSCKEQFCFTISRESSIKMNSILKLNDKYILPNWMHELSDRQVTVFRNELIKGDGSIKHEKMGKDGYIKNTSYALWGKKDLLEQIQILLITHNLPCSLNEQKTRKGQYYLQIRSSNHIEIQRNKKIISYNDASWCVTVKNHTLFLEREGKPFIAGNTTAKPISEDATNSFEYLLGKLLQERFKENKRVEIIVPDSYLYTAEIRGHKYLLFHGSTIRGATLNSIERATKELATLAYKEFYDLIIIGHFHTSLKLRITPETTLLVNGCFIQDDDYAYKKLRKFSSATQYLFNISKKSPMHNLQEINLRWK